MEWRRPLCAASLSSSLGPAAGCCTTRCSARSRCASARWCTAVQRRVAACRPRAPRRTAASPPSAPSPARPLLQRCGACARAPGAGACHAPCRCRWQPRCGAGSVWQWTYRDLLRKDCQCQCHSRSKIMKNISQKSLVTGLISIVILCTIFLMSSIVNVLPRPHASTAETFWYLT